MIILKICSPFKSYSKFHIFLWGKNPSPHTYNLKLIFPLISINNFSCDYIDFVSITFPGSEVVALLGTAVIQGCRVHTSLQLPPCCKFYRSSLPLFYNYKWNHKWRSWNILCSHYWYFSLGMRNNKYKGVDFNTVTFHYNFPKWLP